MKLNGWGRLYVVFVVVSALVGAAWGLWLRSEDIKAAWRLHSLTMEVACMNIGPGSANPILARDLFYKPHYLTSVGEAKTLDDLRGMTENEASSLNLAGASRFVAIGQLQAAAARCDKASHEPVVESPFLPGFLLAIVIVTLGLSLPVLIIGLVVRWVARGFGRPAR